jgi:hypothetical protein
VRRALDADRFPNAYRDADGVWRVPVSDLVAADLAPRFTGTPASDRSIDIAAPDPERDVAHWRERALVAEAVAAERERLIDALNAMLRALPAAPVAPVSDVSQSPVAEHVAAPSQPRRRWWHRSRT